MIRGDLSVHREGWQDQMGALRGTRRKFSELLRFTFP